MLRARKVHPIGSDSKFWISIFTQIEIRNKIYDAFQQYSRFNARREIFSASLLSRVRNHGEYYLKIQKNNNVSVLSVKITGNCQP